MEVFNGASAPFLFLRGFRFARNPRLHGNFRALHWKAETPDLPATFSHPAAAVPFTRMGGVLSALVIGSMIPDIWHLAPELLRRDFTHSFWGQLAFTVPMGIAILLLYHFVMKRPLCALMPQSMQAKVYPLACERFRWWPLSRFLMILVSLWVAGITHIFWDSFTHIHGYAVRLWAPLRTVVYTTNNSWMGREPVTVSWMLQHIFSVLGVVILILWFYGWMKEAVSAEVPDQERLNATTKMLVFAMLLAVSLCAAKIYGDKYAIFWEKHYIAVPKVPKLLLLGREIMAFVNGFFAAVILFCVAIQARWKLMTDPATVR